VFDGGDFRIRALPLRHTKPCYGYTLEENKRPGEFHPEKAEALGVKRGPLWAALQSGQTVKAEDGTDVEPNQVLGSVRSGRKFSFVTDSLAFSEIADEVYGSDLFVCEGMFERALEESAREKKHMTAEQAAFIAKAAHVRKLALIHYSPRYTEYELKQMIKEATDIFPPTILTKDRMVLPIEYID